MKIGIINNLYEPFARGGAEKICKNLVDGFCNKKDDVFVVSTRPYLGIVNFRNSEVKKYYVRSLYLSLSKIPKGLRLIWHFFDVFDIRVFFQIFFILKKEKPDFIILNNLKGLSYLAPFLLKALKIKHMLLLHDIQLIHPSGLMLWGEEAKLNSIVGRIYGHINKVLFSGVDVVVAPSRWLLDLFKERGFFEKSIKKVIPNPVDLFCIDNGIKQKYFNFLFVGQIEKHKGLNILLESFSQFVENNKACLTIVGDGIDFEELSSNCSSDNVIFLGRKKEKEVLEIMCGSNCLVVPSLCYENSPTVIFEALSCGLTVLGSKIGGIPEILSQYNGYLFEPGSVADLCGKMEEVFSNKKDFCLVDLSSLSVEMYINKISSLLK